MTAKIVAKKIDRTDTKIVIETPPRMNGAHSTMKSGVNPPGGARSR